MSLSIFPDVNVWLALSFSDHAHHEPARAWFERLGRGDHLYFCRLTQLGLLRLLSLEAVMGAGEALSQAAAWLIYDRWLSDPAVRFHPEPERMEAGLRRHAAQPRPAPQAWTDDYLCAFAEAASLRLATLDRSLSRRTAGSILIP